jgi:hypothetical protein
VVEPEKLIWVQKIESLWEDYQDAQRIARMLLPDWARHCAGSGTTYVELQRIVEDVFSERDAT